MVIQQNFGVWKSPPYEITLFDYRGQISALLTDEKWDKTSFFSDHVFCGILGKLPHQALIEKIRQLSLERIAVFPYPQENPNELWVFEATHMAALEIRQAKVKLKEAKEGIQPYFFYEKALHKFLKALQFQKNGQEDTLELQEAVKFTRDKMLLCSLKQASDLYLYDSEEIAEFASFLETYKYDKDNLFKNLEKYLDFQKYTSSAHFYLLSAIFNEECGRFLEAAKNYINLADESNPYALACIGKAYTLLQKGKEKDYQDNIRMKFEEALEDISRSSFQVEAPTCFICFNVEEKDVGKWLEDTFVPDLVLVGIKPIFCFRDLNPGDDLDDFQEQARRADQVIIVCTPDFKEKYENRKKAPVGLAQEVRMIKGRYNDFEKANTIFPIFLKGARNDSLPTPYFEPIFGTKIDFYFDFNYFTNAFELFNALRNVPRWTGREIRSNFLAKLKNIMEQPLDMEAVNYWRRAKDYKKRPSLML